MPMEGHWRRVQAPLYTLTKRERMVALLAAGAIVVSILVIVIAGSGTSRPAPGPGCIRASVPGVMGALEVNACGDRAKRLCARAQGRDDAVSRIMRETCADARIS